MLQNELEDVVRGLWQSGHQTPDTQADGNAVQLRRSHRKVFAGSSLVADEKAFGLTVAGGAATKKQEDDYEVGGEERQGDVGDGPDQVAKRLAEGPVLWSEGAVVEGLVNGVWPPSSYRPEVMGVGADEEQDKDQEGVLGSVEGLGGGGGGRRGVADEDEDPAAQVQQEVAGEPEDLAGDLRLDADPTGDVPIEDLLGPVVSRTSAEDEGVEDGQNDQVETDRCVVDEQSSPYCHKGHRVT